MRKIAHEYSIPNVTGVVITTNHKTDGIYLPADDRRHFVAWTDLEKLLSRRNTGTRYGMVRHRAAARSSPIIYAPST